MKKTNQRTTGMYGERCKRCFLFFSITFSTVLSLSSSSKIRYSICTVQWKNKCKADKMLIKGNINDSVKEKGFTGRKKEGNPEPSY